MKVRYLDRKTRNFISYAILLLLLLLVLIGLSAFIYFNFTLNAYNIILEILIAVLALLAVIFALSVFSVIHVYNKKEAGSYLLPFVRLGLKLIIPASVLFAGMMKKDRDSIRSFFIDVNNYIAESNSIRYKPEEVLVLLPHCLQNSACGYKITNDINNCRQCGKCVIGRIKKNTAERGVRAVVVTGGTAARNILVKEHPKMLISVACERDLTSGIMDVNKMPAVARIPVVGLLNQRPNGPCLNTTIDMEKFEAKLDKLLDRGSSRSIDLDDIHKSVDMDFQTGEGTNEQ
jgi:hypothetical protein